jgi:hypothetical protein
VGAVVSYFSGKDGLLILRRIRDWSAQGIEANLRAAFAETDSTIPLDVLATYLVGRSSRWCTGGWRSADLTYPKTSRRRFTACSARQSAMRSG